jgi:glucose-6-phosphate-specific signal transduction histidine kinase
VQDDGHGFDPALRRSVSHGLVGLRYRVQVVHGEWRLDTVPGQGTRVAAVLPLVSSADLDEGPDAVARCQAAPTGMPARH